MQITFEITASESSISFLMIVAAMQIQNTKHLLKYEQKYKIEISFKKILFQTSFVCLFFLGGKEWNHEMFNGIMLKFVSVKGLLDSSRGNWKQNERLMLSLLHYQFEVLKLLIEEQSHI